MNVYHVLIDIVERHGVFINAETEEEAERQVLEMAEVSHDEAESITVFACEKITAIAQQEEAQ